MGKARIHSALYMPSQLASELCFEALAMAHLADDVLDITSVFANRKRILEVEGISNSYAL